MSSSLVGQQVSHYQIKAFLGSGRIGTVYQAVDLKDLSLVALKIIDLEFAEQPDVRRRFLQEVKSLPQLDHPSLIQVYEAGLDTKLDLLYLTMEFITGRNLNTYLQQLQFNKRQIALHEALIVVAQVAEGLDYAHQRGLVHGDVRPNVILFKTDDRPEESGALPGRATIGDFTFATILEQESELFAGSLPYLSPEYFLSQVGDGRSDIYSLGIILFQLLTGRTPFAAETTAEAARQHPYQDPPAPRSIRPDLPVTVENVVFKAMAKKPEDRYQTGATLAAALRQIAETLITKEAVTDAQGDISLIKTESEPPALLAVSATWSANEDRVAITRDVPYSLNRQVVTVGRSENNDIVLPEISITRRHAQLERTSTGWQVRDLGSQNGTYLDGKLLLPDIPEAWGSHQTLRIGPYFLHLHLGKAFEFSGQPFTVSVMPNQIEVHAGQQAALQVTIHHLGANVDEFTLNVERFPADWVTLPETPIRLRPDEQTAVSIPIHPPLAEDILIGSYRYLLTVSPRDHEQDKAAVPGVIQVQPAEEKFSVELLPQQIVGQGRVQLTVRNEGLADRTFHIFNPNVENKLLLGMWRPKVQARTRSGARSTVDGGKRPSPSRSSPLNRIPAIQRLRSTPRRYLARLQAAPRRLLNRILPGMGRLVRLPRLTMPTGRAGKPAPTEAAPTESMPPLAENYEELVFPQGLQTQIDVATGQQEIVYLSVAARKRPLWGPARQTYPVAWTVSNGDGRQQTATAQLEVKPRLRTNWLVRTVLTFLILMAACGLTTIVYTRWVNPIAEAILMAPVDIDEDTLDNLSETYRYQTNPNDVDSDDDSLSDGYEVALGLDPNWPDSDGDGLDDAYELRESRTDPLKTDTDGDSLSDSLEITELGTDPLVETGLPLRVPSPTPTPEAHTTGVFTKIIASRGEEDGEILRIGSQGQFVFEQNGTFQVGEGLEDNQQYKGFLSFDTAVLPDDALVETAVLRLYRTEASGTIANLGEMHLDIAPPSGFNGNGGLENGDFSATAQIANVISIDHTQLDEDWIGGRLTDAGKQAINRQGVTQFRLYFTLPNNHDGMADWVRFAAGDYDEDDSFRPRLIVTYRPSG